MRRSILSLATLGTLLAGSVPAAPVTAQGGANAISPADRQEGAKAHPQLVQEFGGAVTGPQAGYVEQVGKTIAVQSGLSNARGDFTVTLLNSPVNNAFAIPGGYVYVTRNLVGLMNNEAELAGVLGHEVGHVAARHAAKRESAATRNAIIGILGSVLSGAIFGNTALGQAGSQLFSTGSQLLTLRYSRAQETEADNLGVRYLQRAGYDPHAMASVLRSLAAQTALDSQISGSADGERMPEWASTHPEPAARVAAADAQAGSARGLTNRDVFLARIDGLTYDDDPRQGVVEGRTFVHPGYRMAFSAPPGFYLANGTRSVRISGQSGKGELAGGSFDGNLDAYVRAAFAKLAQGAQPSAVSRTTINGIPAAIATRRMTSGGSAVDVTVVGYAWGPQQAFHFATIARAGESGVFDSMFRSIRRIDAAEAGMVRPRRIAVRTVSSGDTVASLSSLMAYRDRKLERFLVLNALNADARLQPGQKVKLITY
ncbi:M48 family metalloprotease [Novosphingobium huizhouense]|uniref:M48 family metalloprotease n=1 Tax=Novosphingobium huizhouense TaxID=2866625 RepID=UPI001CD8A269|nr:M48 family metalloprotease [Novosphingobium huizhouense]